MSATSVAPRGAILRSTAPQRSKRRGARTRPPSLDARGFASWPVVRRDQVMWITFGDIAAVVVGSLVAGAWGPTCAALTAGVGACAVALAWLLGAAVTTLLAWGVQWTLGQLPIWLAVPLLALCLKPLFAWTLLHDLVAQVEMALGQGLQAGREQLAHLVSRDVQQLDEAGVRESAIETLAENLSDSVVAPLLWFALLGLPGAALYRFANTADAMWGYPGVHGGRHWQWAGKWAAHADDVLNWLPARLTAGLLMLGARRTLWRALPAQATLTPSPNGGWPMGAMALRLGVGLGKPGVYRLNAQAQAPQTIHTWQALRRARFAAWLAVVLCTGGAVLSGPWG